MFRQVGIYTGSIVTRRKARRPSGRAIDQIRTCDQPQDDRRPWASKYRRRLLARADEVIE
jgi:hypothetical protein